MPSMNGRQRKYGHNIVVSGDDLADYDPETCHYSGSGQVLDLDHLMIYGDETQATFRMSLLC